MISPEMALPAFPLILEMQLESVFRVITFSNAILTSWLYMELHNFVLVIVYLLDKCLNAIVFIRANKAHLFIYNYDHSVFRIWTRILPYIVYRNSRFWGKHITRALHVYLLVLIMQLQYVRYVLVEGFFRLPIILMCNLLINHGWLHLSGASASLLRHPPPPRRTFPSASSHPL